MIEGLPRYLDAPSVPIVLIVSWRCWCGCRHHKTFPFSVTYYALPFLHIADLRSVATGVFEALYCHTRIL